MKKNAGSNMSRTRDPGKTPIVGGDADWAQRTNINSVQGSGNSGRVMDATSSMKTAGTHLTDEEADKVLKAVKGLAAGTAVLGATAGGIGGYYLGKRKGKKESEQSQKINLDSHHKLNPEAAPVKTASSHMALDRYPLNSYGEVQEAMKYFSMNAGEFTPRERHEFSVKTAARADELGIQKTASIARYGSTEYSPDLDAHLANRKALAPSFDWEKVASVRHHTDPETFAMILEKADEEAGLNWYYGGHLMDPYFATFGGNKVKEAQEAWGWQSPQGDSVNYSQLTGLSSEKLSEHFDESFTSAFSKSPVEIFESMPDTHKTIIARLASSEN
jgi:hypothetical protein